MVFIVPDSNWTDAIIEAISKSEDGDTIQVSTESKKMMAKRGHIRICKDKKLTFTVVPKSYGT